MSTPTDAFDALVARIVAVYPDHVRLPDGEQIEENTEQQLKKGVGMWPEAAENSERMVSCQGSLRRDYKVTLTRVVRANEFNLTPKEDAMKTLLEDQFKIIKDIEKDPHLADSGNIAQARFLSDGGVVRVFDDKDTFWKIETVVSVEYFYDLT